MKKGKAFLWVHWIKYQKNFWIFVFFQENGCWFKKLWLVMRKYHKKYGFEVEYMEAKVDRVWWHDSLHIRRDIFSKKKGIMKIKWRTSLPNSLFSTVSSLNLSRTPKYNFKPTQKQFHLKEISQNISLFPSHSPSSLFPLPSPSLSPSPPSPLPLVMTLIYHSYIVLQLYSIK